MPASISLLLWLGSLVAGWNHYYPWLALPVIAYLAFIIWADRHAMEAYRKYGMSGVNFRRKMLGPNLLLIIWNTLLNALIFGVGVLIFGLF
jgi:hypothetical protein